MKNRSDAMYAFIIICCLVIALVHSVDVIYKSLYRPVSPPAHLIPITSETESDQI